MKVIPFIQGTSSFEEVITLSDIVYRVRIRWNTRDEAWYMDVYEQDGTPIMSGVKLVLNWDSQSRYIGRALPSGVIIPVDISGEETAITRDNLGDTVLIVYATTSEIDAII